MARELDPVGAGPDFLSDPGTDLVAAVCRRQFQWPATSLVFVGDHSAEVTVAAARRNHVRRHHHSRALDDACCHRVAQVDRGVIDISAAQVAHGGEPVHQQRAQYRQGLQRLRGARLEGERQADRRRQRHVDVAVHEARRQGVPGKIHHPCVGRRLDRVGDALDTAVDDQHLSRRRLGRDAVPHVRTGDQRCRHRHHLSGSQKR